MFRALIDQILLTWWLLKDPRVPLWHKLIPLVAAVYVLSPIDFIPDFLVGLGQLDDFGVLLGSMRLFESLVPEYVVAEHRLALARRHKPLEVVDAPGYRIIGREKPESD